MLESLVNFGQVLVILWGVMLLHMLGHYYTARQIVEIPSEEVRLVSPLRPRYVALRDDEEWVPPYEFERYRRCYERHDPEYTHFERYVAGGEIIQALVVLPVAIGLAVSGLDDVAATVLVISILTTAVYVSFDAVRTRLNGTVSGDYSALWRISPRIPVLLLLGFLFVHLGAFFFVS